MTQEILNWIDGKKSPAKGGFFEKRSPHDGTVIGRVARSSAEEVNAAVSAARRACASWRQTPPVKRGELLGELAGILKKKREEMARLLARETGRSMVSALGEVDGAVSLGYFFAGEGQRLFGRTIASGVPGRQVMTVRQPLGVAALIIAANTPIANVAWKVFPALVCGNTAVLKAAEDAPGVSDLFAQWAHEAGIPAGVLNVVQGLGAEAGAALTDHPGVDVISFTGSTAVGRAIAEKAARRLCRVSLELGGKNPFVVCDDADLENAVRWTVLSAFSNAGQRCSAAGRILIFKTIYDKFKAMLLDRTRALKVGPADTDDLGPLISQVQLDKVAGVVERAKAAGAKVLAGGERLRDASHASGYYFAPTVIEGASPRDEISSIEIFGPVAVLYPVSDMDEALELSNDSVYGLTAAIHTASLHRAHAYAERVEAGIVSVNAGTFGSEPHLPFGGRKQSGNGTREPGTEALDVYTELKNVYINIDTGKL